MRYLLPYLLILSFSLCVNAQRTVTFVLEAAPVAEYVTIGIRGSLPPLSWEQTTPLSVVDGRLTATVNFPESGEPLAFKYVYHLSPGSDPTWEQTENRSLRFSSGEDTYSADWEVLPLIDPATVPPLTPEQLMADYPLIERVVRDLHPGTYRYQTERELDAALARLRDHFSAPLTVEEAYLALNELTATLRCGHTGSPLYNQGPIVNSILHRQADKLPFTFTWREERMIVRYDATPDNLLPAGSEVLTLGERPVADILRELRRYVPSDGPEVPPVDGLLSLRGYPFNYDIFDALYPLVFPLPEDGLSVTYRTEPGGPVRKAKLTPLTREARAETLVGRFPTFPARADDQYHLDLRDNETAVLTVGNFLGNGPGALEMDYQEFFADVFAKIRAAGVTKLILDVRENQGGSDEIVRELFTYFPVKKIQRAGFTGRIRYTSLPTELRPYIRTWGDNPWFYEPKVGEYRPDGDYYELPKEFTGTVRNRVKKDAFGGQVVFLVGRDNASLGFYLARNVKRLGLGTLIGETTAGCLRGISGGQILFLRLPQTDLELDFPIVGGFATGEQPSHGVVPDVLVPITANQLLTGKDAVLDAALEYLGKE
ncbi:MAG: S41 family peptidase [Bacteroidota bacterium]